MALSTTPLDATRFRDILTKQTAATGTADADLAGRAITLYGGIVSNAGSDPAHVRIYNANTAAAGSTPVLMFRVDTATPDNRAFFLPDGMALSVGATHRVTASPGVSVASEGATVSGGNVEVILVLS